MALFDGVTLALVGPDADEREWRAEQAAEGEDHAAHCEVVPSERFGLEFARRKEKGEDRGDHDPDEDEPDR